MLRKSLFVAIAAALAAVLSPAEARAWGAAHVGYTHVGPYGVQHYGRTVAAGPNGAYAGGHTSAYGYGGASYHAGGAAGYHYGYGGASAGGYHYGAVHTGYGYQAGAYRRY